MPQEGAVSARFKDISTPGSKVEMGPEVMKRVPHQCKRQGLYMYLPIFAECSCSSCQLSLTSHCFNVWFCKDALGFL
jgi:hypothetical protein